ALAGRVAGSRRLSWRHGARFKAGEMRGVVGETAGGPKLAVADAVAPDLDLFPPGFRNGGRHLLRNDRGIGYLGIGEPRRHVLPALGRRQPADMRGSDARQALLHPPVLPLSVWFPAHDNT